MFRGSCLYKQYLDDSITMYYPILKYYNTVAPLCKEVKICKNPDKKQKILCEACDSTARKAESHAIRPIFDGSRRLTAVGERGEGTLWLCVSGNAGRDEKRQTEEALKRGKSHRTPQLAAAAFCMEGDWVV